MTVDVVAGLPTAERIPAGVPRAGSEYSELGRQVRGASLLDHRPGWYSARVAVNLGLLGAGWAGFVLLGNSWWQLGIAAFLAVMFTQVAFVGHDAGHRQVVTGRRRSAAVGLLHANVLVGLSYGWWVAKHNRHHSHPNEIGRDPDVATGVFVFIPGEGGDRRGAARWFTSHQAYLFFPMLVLEGLALHIASVRELAGRRGRSAGIEATLLLVHIAGYLAAVALVLPPVKAIVFVLVHQALFGFYMGCSFAPNHKGMPLLAHDKQDFLRRQVLTARNIRGGRLTDLVLGGLNYQIEHHLFPSMPRPNLRRAQPLVRAFCLAHGVDYREDSALGSYRDALRWLHAVGAPLRRPIPDVG